MFSINYYYISFYLFLPFNYFYFTKNNFVLNLSFSFKKIIISVSSYKEKILAHITPGLFFWKLNTKKALKKSTKIKLLQIRFVKKFLFLLNVTNTNLKFIRLMKNYKFIFNNLTKPINHFFLSPIEENNIILNKKVALLKILTLIFDKQLAFYKLKTKKKSRLKRKISRKLLKLRYFEN